MDKKFYNKIISLLPSKDLIDCIKAEKFIFEEEELLKFINDYAPDFNKRLELFREAEKVFRDKTAKVHAKKLIAESEYDYNEFMRADDTCVYEINIKCSPNGPDEETLLTKTFDGAVEMIKSWLKCFKDIGAKDNKLARYKICKKTIIQPRYPRDIANDKIGTLGDCVLGYRFKILDLATYKHRSEMLCKSNVNCMDCETPCVSCLEPRFPHFLKHYDLVAYHSKRLYDPTKIEYGIFDGNMEECDYDSCFIYLDNKYIKERKVDFKDEYGYYPVFYAHDHPSYAELFKPDIADVPKEIYDDYLYAVEELKKIDD